MKFTVPKMQRSVLSIAAATALMAASCANTSHATQVWYDGFTTTGAGGDYVVATSAPDGADLGPDLAGQSGGNDAGSGTPFFAGPWLAATYPDTVTFQNNKVFAAGLDRPGLITPAIGGSVGNTPHFGGCCFESRTSRMMAQPWHGFTQPDGTFYLSFLANYGAGTDVDVQHRSFEMHDAGFDDDPNRNLMLGFMAFIPNNNKLLDLAVRDDDTGDTAFETMLVDGKHVTLNNMAIQGTHLMVLKFDMSTSGNDVISAFLDPVGTTEPAPNAQITVGNFIADRMSAIAQFSYNGGPTSAFIDEIRVGTTFADVANNTLAFVPEPATFTLLGLAVGCVSMIRRKRS